MIHVIDKMDTCKSTGPTTLANIKTGRNGTLTRSRSPQSQSQPLPNGIINPLPDSNLVPNDHAQRLLLENCNMPVIEPDMSALTLSDKAIDVNEEAASLFDDSDITPPSPLLSNAIPPPSLLPSSSLFHNNHKPQSSSFMLPNKFAEMKLKQEVSLKIRFWC